jgi:hypothetical protein
MQEQHVWCGLADEAGVIKFSSAQEAIKAVDSYLEAYEKKFSEVSYNRERIDLSTGSLRVAGGFFGNNPEAESK